MKPLFDSENVKFPLFRRGDRSCLKTGAMFIHADSGALGNDKYLTYKELEETLASGRPPLVLFTEQFTFITPQRFLLTGCRKNLMLRYSDGSRSIEELEEYLISDTYYYLGTFGGGGMIMSPKYFMNLVKLANIMDSRSGVDAVEKLLDGSGSLPDNESVEAATKDEIAIWGFNSFNKTK